MEATSNGNQPTRTPPITHAAHRWVSSRSRFRGRRTTLMAPNGHCLEHAPHPMHSSSAMLRRQGTGACFENDLFPLSVGGPAGDRSVTVFGCWTETSEIWRTIPVPAKPCVNSPRYGDNPNRLRCGNKRLGLNDRRGAQGQRWHAPTGRRAGRGRGAYAAGCPPNVMSTQWGPCRTTGQQRTHSCRQRRGWARPPALRLMRRGGGE